MPLSCSRREQPQLVQPVVDQRAARACVASTVTRLTMSLGKPATPRS